jgi:hypothetical protein
VGRFLKAGMPLRHARSRELVQSMKGAHDEFLGSSSRPLNFVAIRSRPSPFRLGF